MTDQLYMFQVHVRHVDAAQSRKKYTTIAFTIGEWFHFGLSYYDGVATAYKNGCLGQRNPNWGVDPSVWLTNEGILFGGDNSNIDVELDEVYVWEVRKPASVFSVLYGKGI